MIRLPSVRGFHEPEETSDVDAGSAPQSVRPPIAQGHGGDVRQDYGARPVVRGSRRPNRDRAAGRGTSVDRPCSDRIAPVGYLRP
jgi:hypothetical protein